MWARLGPPLARLLFLAAVLLALPMARSFFRADRLAVAQDGGMLQATSIDGTDGRISLTGLNDWLLIEADRGDLIITKVTGPVLAFTFSPDEKWISHDATHFSSHVVDPARRLPPMSHRVIGGQGFNVCFWVSWPMKQPPRTFGSTYLFTAAGGPDFQIALPLPLLVPLMAVPFAILTWQRWKLGRPKGFDVEVTQTPEDA